MTSEFETDAAVERIGLGILNPKPSTLSNKPSFHFPKTPMEWRDNWAAVKCAPRESAGLYH